MLQEIGLYYVFGLVYFALVNNSHKPEEITKPWAFYTVGLFLIATLWLPTLVLYIFQGQRDCKQCGRPVPKTDGGFICPYCTT